MQPPGGQYGPPGRQQGLPPGGPPGPPQYPPPGHPSYPQQGPPPAWPGGPQGPGQPPVGQPGYPPPGYQQPPPGQPAPPPQPVALPAQAGAGTGRLVIDAKCSWLVWMLWLIGKPEININGGQVPAQWGPTTVDLPEGQHNVDVVVKYLWPVGRALTVVPVQAGQQTVLYYKAPVMVWSAGALDSEPGGYPGMAAAIGLLVGMAVLVLLLILLPLLF